MAHEGKKELKLIIPNTPLEDIDWDAAGDGMTTLLHDNLVDKDLQTWIIPNFSTTTRVDRTVSAMLMMASMKKYFSYTFSMLCGIPQVTFEGTKQDWLDIQSRLSKLDSWDDKTRSWKRLLLPVISKFIAAFEGEVDTDFWSHVVHQNRYGSGSEVISGWITAFTVFTENGHWMGEKTTAEGYVLDEITYPAIDGNHIPVGVANVDIKVIDGVGRNWPAMLIAGNMGMSVSGDAQDTVQSVPVWCYYLKGENDGKTEKETDK